MEGKIITKREVMVGLREQIINTLKKNPDGLTLSKLSEESKLTKDQVRITVAKLEGAKKVKVIDVGMARLVILEEKQK